jgi:hypothetical protein
MPRTHHRKAHKQHLQNFKQWQADGDHLHGKKKISAVLATIGAVLGLAIGYMSTSGQWLWMMAGAAIFGIVGFIIGNKIDK